MCKTAVRFVGALAATLLIASPCFSRELTFEQRVAVQTAIEQVYWNHRIWPAENPGPKPPLSAVMSDAAIRARVEDYLKKSNALATIWQRPITAEQLQAEMDRMAAHTRDAKVLKEIFDALGNDPFLIAEALARQTLADRLIRNWYAFDSRFHGELKAKAEAALARVSSGAELPALGAKYAETTWRLKGGNEASEEPAPGEISLPGEEWRKKLAESDEKPLLAMSALQESDDAFFVASVLKRGTDSVTEATASWPKVAFDAWWAQQSAGTSEALAPVEGEFTIGEVTSLGACVPDTWAAIRWAPSERQLATAVWTGSEMIVWGGYGDGMLNTGGRYNPSTDSWVATTTNGAPSVRNYHTAIWTGSEMIIWGGNGADYFNTGGRYNPSTDSWSGTAVGANLPAARTFHTAVWTGTEMIVWGGWNGSTSFNTGGRYSPSTNTWSATSAGTNLPAGRYWHTAVWTGNRMIIWGGQNAATYFNSGGRYNPFTDDWVATKTIGAPGPRSVQSAVWTGSEMIVWGGEGPDPQGGGRYDPLTDTWVATTTAGAPSVRTNHTAVWTGSTMIIWGGQGAASYFNSGGRYDPSTNSWVATTTTGAPSRRDWHTAVWTGSEMIVWGGRNATSFFDSGGRYDPSTDSWVATKTAVAPSARNDHSAVWTGSEMIIWGGYNGSALNTGGRYNPSTDSWVATTAIDAPTERSIHRAVWTGSEMIIWGGYNGSALNTGGRYNPSTDAWVATTSAGAPSARYGQATVWTGTEMIVWGGRDLSGYFDSGGHYNPSTDRWLPTSSIGAPSARNYSTAVWTGSEMIVWGGYNSGTYLRTGGRYRPSMDSWVPTTTTGAPEGRYRHTAVWTGSGMIAWGGRNATNSFDSGGRYDTSTDSWVETTAVGAPAGRYLHAAVWTGSEMIVWGGYNGSNDLETGGRYNPSTDSWAATTTIGVPTAREYHTAAWTGAEMIVWGGFAGSYLNSGGSYCVFDCAVPATWYQDSDGDGYGVATVTQLACTQPAGFSALVGDCNDTNPHCTTNCTDADADGYCAAQDCDDNTSTVFPGAPQLCDGRNNDCTDPRWPVLSSNVWMDRVISRSRDNGQAVAAGDIDGDGDTDALSASHDDNTIAWHENVAGNGSSWSEHLISTDNNATQSAILADVDGDGVLDVVSGSTPKVAWYENAAGDGSSWVEHIIVAKGLAAFEVSAADLDNDGDLDVAVASWNYSTVYWYENTAGDGTTWTEHTVSGGGGPTCVATADVDSDGDMDILAGLYNADQFVWFDNAVGDGTLWIARRIGGGVDGLRSIAAADVDGDGDLDAISASDIDATVAWYENASGDGTAWNEHVITSSAAGATAVVPVDLDRDGDMDIGAASWANNKVVWYENTMGHGAAWIERTISNANNGPTSLVFADGDGDGDLDAFMAGSNDVIAWHEQISGINELDEDADGLRECGGDCNDNDPNNRTSCAVCNDADADGWYSDCDAYVTIDGPDCDPNNGYCSGDCTDSDADGYCAAQDCDDSTSTVYPGAPQLCDGRNNDCSNPLWPGLSGTAWTDRVISRSRDNGQAIAAGDIDGDGDTDGLSASHDDNTIAWHENVAGNGNSWSEHLISTDNYATQSAILADVDGDGVLDVVSGSTPKVAWYENAVGDGSSWVEHIIVAKGLAAFEVSAADLDNDGDLDVAVASWNYSTVYWYENLAGNGTTWTEHTVSGGGGPTCIATADVDSDGDMDILAGLYNADQFVWFENAAGDASVWTKRTLGAGVDGLRSIAASDVDGDGDLDAMSASDIDSTVAWYENTTGDGTTWIEHVITSSAAGATAVFPVDLDRDGDMDIGAASAANNKVVWYENTMRHGTVWSEHVISNASNGASSLVFADGNGDGDLDAFTACNGDVIAWYERTWGTNESDEDADDFTECSGDCNDRDPNNWSSCGTCADADADGWFSGCDAYVTIGGPDCDPNNRHCSVDCTDVDADGYCVAADCNDAKPHCTTNCTDADEDGYCVTTDCNDADAAIHPGVAEVCDGRDQDCDGFVDEGFDADRDNVADCFDNCWTTSNPYQENSDGDAYGNTCDNCRFVANNDQANDDQDQYGNACDNCPAATNPTQVDSNGNGQGDACEPDADGDGVPDDDGDGIPDPCAGGATTECDDNCRVVFNPDQQDSDADGVGQACDNCPFVLNPGQANADLDRAGDDCDICTDSDGDDLGDPGFASNVCPDDPCPFDPGDDADLDGLCGDADNCPDDANADQSDDDGDGCGNVCDNCVSVPNSGQQDDDRDGLGNACDGDMDGDGVPNGQDADQDRDGVPEDDGDGIWDPCPDRVTLNCDDNCPAVRNPGQRDSDGDGDGDSCDYNDGQVNGAATYTAPPRPFVEVLTEATVPRLAWEPENDALAYNVYRGELASLAQRVYGTCYRNGLEARYTSIPEDPMPGQGYFFLVTAEFSGGEGSLGRDSDGVERYPLARCD